MERTPPDKLPIKRVELSLSKFNEVAIPHHLDLLKRHKANIAKYIAAGDLKLLKNEEINARRIASQLKNLLLEMDVLRQRVNESDIPKFDKLTKRSRDKSVDAIKGYLDLFQKDAKCVEKLEEKGDSLFRNQNSSDTEKQNAIDGQIIEKKTSEGRDAVQLEKRIQLVIDDDELKLAEKRACLQVWEELHTDMAEIHGLFVNFQQALESQRTNLDITEGNVVSTAVNVDQGRRFLASAEKAKIAMLPIMCAVIGGCLGGPIGLALGVKIGGVAALGGGFMGFTGGRMLKQHVGSKIEQNSAKSESESEKNKQLSNFPLD